MDKSHSIALIALLSGTLTFFGESFAHSTEHKVKRSMATDAQMKKLHTMMPVFSLASAELESALEKGDAVAASTQADKILVFVPDLKKSRPHKNVKQHKKFVELATNFEKTLIATVDLINKNDLSGAKTAFKKVEEACAACHARFRD